MKKQLAIATVAIMLMTLLLAPPVMAFAVRDGDSVQYSSHRGLNYIADKSVTASNPPYITLSNGIGERENIDRASAPVTVGGSIYKASLSTVMDKQSGMRVVKGKIAYADGFFVYSADGELLYFIGTDVRQLLKAAPLASM